MRRGARGGKDHSRPRAPRLRLLPSSYDFSGQGGGSAPGPARGSSCAPAGAPPQAQRSRAQPPAAPPAASARPAWRARRSSLPRGPPEPAPCRPSCPWWPPHPPCKPLAACRPPAPGRGSRGSRRQGGLRDARGRLRGLEKPSATALTVCGVAMRPRAKSLGPDPSLPSTRPICSE